MSDPSADPLDLLRQSVLSSLPPVLLSAASDPAPTLPLATYISFPQPSGSALNVPKDAPTRYTSKVGSLDEFYNVGQLWLAWTERETGVREYLMKGQATGVGYVGIADRKGVVDYLKGESEGTGRVLMVGAQAGTITPPAAGLRA
jgi:parafibromin